MNKLIIFLAISLVVLGCKNNSKQTVEVDKTPTELAPVPFEKLQKLWVECDYIDVIFYHLSHSISQNDQRGIKASLLHIDTTRAQINPACNSVGRISYFIQGNLSLEGDLYFNDSCKYIIFLEEDKPAFSNKLTSQGISFYNQVMAQ
jgi:hypothetical protein